MQGSVFLFSDGGVNTLVGEIYWFASVGSELVVGFSTWPVRKNCGIYRKVRVVEDFSRSWLHTSVHDSQLAKTAADCVNIQYMTMKMSMTM